MGDAGGVGPEVVIKSLAASSVRKICRPLVVGDVGILRKCLPHAGKTIRLLPVRANSGGAFPPGVVPVINPARPIGVHRWGVARKSYGAAAMKYVRFAAEEAMSGKVDGIVTAPICKEAVRRAGFEFEGHTDYLAHLTGAGSYAMMLTGRGLSVVLVTVHLALARVSKVLSIPAVLRAIKLAHQACVRMGTAKPRIGVCGFNPHAGEAGAFGCEERRKIAPAVRAAVRLGIIAEGPFPSDTIFVESARKRFDAIVAMYHDQGLIPLKMLAFDVAVNVTLGLPIVRTSPDHGTAFDIAGKGVADPGSMIAAVKLAVKLSRKSDAES